MLLLSPTHYKFHTPCVPQPIRIWWRVHIIWKEVACFFEACLWAAFCLHLCMSSCFIPQFAVLVTGGPALCKLWNNTNCYAVVQGTDLCKWWWNFCCCCRAVGFLTQFASHVEILVKLGPELQQLCSALQSSSLPAMRERVHDTMSCYWMALLKTHPLDRQRDARFQSLLSIALEKWVFFFYLNLIIFVSVFVYFILLVG
jgi:hypothetical protein